MSEFDTNLDARTVSTMEETDKKCPNCGGVMDFDPKQEVFFVRTVDIHRKSQQRRTSRRKRLSYPLILRKTQKTATGVWRRKP